MLQTTDLKAAALYYASLGWRVVPNHTARPDGTCSCGKPGCRDVGKHPRYDLTLLPHGIKDATTDPAKIEKWWTRWPDANVGIATGAASGLVVLDEDEPSNDGDSLSDLEATNGPLPITVTVRSGSGKRHRYFLQTTGSIGTSQKALACDADVLGEGGQVIAPPSLHRTGGRYRFEPGCGPDEIRPQPLPDWLRRKLESSSRDSSQGTVPPKIEAGERNDTFSTIAGHMRRLGLDYDEILPTCLEINQRRGEPPLSDGEVMKIVRSICKYPAGESQGEWKDPIPLNAYAPPPFPVEALPPWLGDWVQAEAEATATPPDFAGMVGIALSAAGLSKKAGVEVEEGRVLPLNIYTILAAESSSRKSTVFSHGSAPVEEYEKEERERMQPEIRRLTLKRQFLEEKLKRLRTGKVEAGDEDE